MAKAREQKSDEGTQKVDLSDVKNSDIAKAIDEYIHSERDRKILKRRLIDGIYYEPLADEMGMSVRRIKDIVSKAEARLFKHL